MAKIHIARNTRRVAIYQFLLKPIANPPPAWRFYAINLQCSGNLVRFILPTY